MKRRLTPFEIENYDKELTMEYGWIMGRISSLKEHGEVMGIYAIHNKRTDLIYIGSSTNLMSRFRQHVSGLRNRKHQNRCLQGDYVKFQEQNFCFKILEYCNHSELAKLEGKYLKHYSGRLYNQSASDDWFRNRFIYSR